MAVVCVFKVLLLNNTVAIQMPHSPDTRSVNEASNLLRICAFSVATSNP
jgi:hypothetical protein